MFVQFIIENLHLFMLCTRNDVEFSRKIIENAVKAQKDRKLTFYTVDLTVKVYIHLFICTILVFLSKIIHELFGNIIDKVYNL